MPNRALKSRSRDEDDCGGDPFEFGCVDAGNGRVRGSAILVLHINTPNHKHTHNLGSGIGEVLVLPLVVGLEEHVTRVRRR